MKYTRILYEKKNHIAVITLNRPEARNAWSYPMHTELVDLFTKLNVDPDVLCIILTGNQKGKAFCAGADIADSTTHTISSVGEALAQNLPGGMDVFDAVSDCSKPIICAINGYSLGIGFLIPLCCDILIASENAIMGLPQTGIGIIPNYGGSVRLAQFIGKGAAMRMALTSQRVTAKEAFRMGIVSEVVPLKELMPTAMKLAKQIAALPPLAAKLAKESLNMGLDRGFKSASKADVYRFMLLSMTEDRLEGHSAWREKRQPKFKGR